MAVVQRGQTWVGMEDGEEGQSWVIAKDGGSYGPYVLDSEVIGAPQRTDRCIKDMVAREFV